MILRENILNNIQKALVTKQEKDIKSRKKAMMKEIIPKHTHTHTERIYKELLEINKKKLNNCR